MRRDPRTAQTIGQPPCPAHHLFRVRTCADRHQQAVTGFPRAGNLAGLHVIANVLPDPFRCQTQRHFTKRSEIALAEEIARGGIRAFGQVDFSFSQPL